MPIFQIIAGILMAGSAAVGIGAQIDAKETNGRAQKLSEEAQKLYNETKDQLDIAQNKTESSLMKLGSSKKEVLDSSIHQFLVAYSHIKNIELSQSVGLNELENFSVDRQGALQLREMSNIYQSAFSSSAAGAVAGTTIALAAGGYLPVATGLLSTAGTAILGGQFGIAAGLTSSALSFASAVTPLSAIAAPVLLFSGISSSIKADENLEKAKTMYAEAEAATEQMKTSIVLCNGIADRADMFDDLLLKLNYMFSQCSATLYTTIRHKVREQNSRIIDARTLTKDELKLLAVTRALAGAVKSVIDTPILTTEGSLSDESKEVFDATTKQLPAFSKAVSEIHVVHHKRLGPKTKANYAKPTSILNETRNIIALIISIIESVIIAGVENGAFITWLITFPAFALWLMENEPKSIFFKRIKGICTIALPLGFTLLFFKKGHILAMSKGAFIISLIIAGASIFVLEKTMPDDNEKRSGLKRALCRMAGCVFFFTLAVLAYMFFHRLFRIPRLLVTIVIGILYCFCAFASVQMGDK